MGVLWRTPINEKIQSMKLHGNRLYAGTQEGELIVMNATGGAITQRTKLTEQAVQIDYAWDGAVLVRSGNTMFALTAPGTKNWEYGPVDQMGEVTYFNGVVTVYTSPLQISGFVWRPAKCCGSMRPAANRTCSWLTGGSLFWEIPA